MLEPRRYLVKEQLAFFRSHHIYDVFDAETQEQIGQAEEKISFTTRVLRWFVSQQLMPTRVEVREFPDRSLVFTISRGWYLFRSRVEIHDADGVMIGYFKSKLISFSGGFYIYDKNDKQFGEVKGNLIGFNYRVMTPEKDYEMGTITKKWGGVAKELFTSADTYMVEINEDLQEQPIAKMLVLAAALATDIIFKATSNKPGNLLDV